MATMDGKRRLFPFITMTTTIFKSWLEDFQMQIREAGFEDLIHYLMHGETYTLEVNSKKKNNNNT
jgi:hypothetical protein